MKQRRCSIRPVYCLVVALTVMPAGAQSLTAEQVVDLKIVTEVALSASGERVAYALRVPRGADDGPGPDHTELWVAPASPAEPKSFVRAPSDISSPAFSPDGRWITFLEKRSNSGEATQIFAIAVDGGEARALTRHPTSVSAYRWSPDGRWIAFTAVDEKSEEIRKGEKEGRDWTIYHEDDQHRRLWLLEVESRQSRPVYSGNLTCWDFVWAPDSQTLFLQASERALTDDSYMFRRIFTVPVGGGEPQRVTETAGKLGEMAVSPDGRWLAFLGAVSLNDPLAQSLFVVPVSGGEARNLTEDYEGSGEFLFWLDSGNILLISVEGTQNALSRVPVSGQPREQLVWSGLIIAAAAADAGKQRLAVAAHSPLHPSDVFLATSDGTELRRLSQHNPELDSLQLARQEVVKWPAADGRSLEGILTYPMDYREGQRFPLVLQVHGGPEGISLNGWVTTPGYPVQLLAGAGFLVFQPNYRGSGGRGVEFSKADHRDLGGAEFQDVLAGIDALVERGLADPQRVATGGWSYGGYFSAWAATRYPSRFRAAVVGAGIGNWISFAGTTDIPFEMSLVHWDSWWFDEPELHWERSPLAHVSQSSSPTLIFHGLKDERVHPAQGMELYHALHQRNVETRLILYPREPHGLRERAHQLHYMEEVLKWFKSHLN